MENYIGKVCPFCKTEIKEGEEVKVCPACAIPHHAGCWAENKGCTTFGCSEQNCEERAAAPVAEAPLASIAEAPSAPSAPAAPACAVCGTALAENDAFCPNCGNRRPVAPQKLCAQCGTALAADQDFCPRCGAKFGAVEAQPAMSAINQFNAGVEKKKKKSKVLPIILSILLVVLIIGGVGGYSAVQKQKIADYKADAYAFSSKVLSVGTEMEDIGNDIKTSWRQYVNSSRNTYYYGTYVYSADTAVGAAQKHMASEISAVKAMDSTISSLYTSLLKLPSNNQELVEIKAAVKEVYDAYQEMYDCVITPSGNYNTWSAEFSRVDTALANAIGDLSDLTR